MKQFYILLLALALTATHLTEAKRTLSSGRRTSSSGGSSYSNRRTTYTQTSAPKVTKTQSTYNQQQSKPIGWNTQGNPQGPPPAYSASNTAGAGRTNMYEKPPSYSAGNQAPPSYQQSAGGSSVIKAQTQRPLQSGAYPKQQMPSGTYPHGTQSQIPQGAKYYPQGQVPAGATYYPAGHMPGGASYHPAGHMPPGATYYPAGGYHPPMGAAPVQSFPVASGVQPGYYPAGSFPRQSSGPGLGTGLIAGAVGGAILGHVLTPTHKEVIQTQGGSNSNGNDPAVVIINNTPGQPPQVTTANGNQPIIVNNPGAPGQPGAPAQQGEAAVPLAPFQPGSTQTQALPAGAVSPPLIHNPQQPGNPDGTVPLAPVPPFAPGTGNSSDPAAAQQPQPGGVYCTPVMVNVTSPTDPTNITQVEQIACYEVPAQPPQAQLNQQPAINAASQGPDLMHMPGDTITQRTSTATVAESAQIKQSGAAGKEISILTTFTSTAVAVLLAYCLQ